MSEQTGIGTEPRKYKFITIKQVDGEVFSGSPVFRIFNNRSNDQIGIISYYKPWKQFVFSSHDGCVFNNTCLRYIIGFLEAL